jgi:hypothetical protein
MSRSAGSLLSDDSRTLAAAGVGPGARLHCLGHTAEMPAAVRLGLYPFVSSQHSSTTLYQVSYHVQWLDFESDNRI